MKDWKIKLDCVFVVSLAVTATIALCGCKSAEVAEITLEPTALATIAETTETVTEPTGTEPTVTAETGPTQTVATEPPITLYDVPLSEDLQLHMIETAEKYGIDPAYVFGIAYVESTFNANCIGDSGDSYGLMQVQPYWHGERMKRLGCWDLLDPFQNVTVAVDYLAEMLRWYDRDITKALVAYNQGSYKGTITNYAKAVLTTAEEMEVID